MILRILLILSAASILATAQEKSPRTDRGKASPATPLPAPGVRLTQSAPTVSTQPAPAAPAATPAVPVPEDLPTRMVADFFALIAKGQIDEAYANLTKGSKTIEKPEDLRLLKQKTREAIEVFGAINGHELVESKPVGTRLIRRTYVSLGAEFPLRWRFYFYNVNDRWRLIDLRVDDRLPGMFDEPKETTDDRSERP
jgi:hypothetical protein